MSSPVVAQPRAAKGPSSLAKQQGAWRQTVPVRAQSVKCDEPVRAFHAASQAVTRNGMATAMEPAKWVRAVRLALEIKSQEAFAEKLGVGRSAVAKWENGVQRPNLASFKKLVAMAPNELKRVAPDAQLFEINEMSDRGSKLPPGLEGFLERHGKHISDSEKDLLRRATHLADPSIDTSSDAFWWDYVKNVLRKYFRPPD